LTIIVGISIAIAIPSIALAMAIGPMAGFAKKLGRAVRYWAAYILVIIVGLIVGVLLTAIVIALIPVAIGLIIAAVPVYLFALALFYFCKWLWKFTPHYRKRKARKIREISDLEDAARDEGPEIRINDEPDDVNNGESENGINKKAPVVMERSVESQHIPGNGEEIEEVHQSPLL
jgi:MFS family permease